MMKKHYETLRLFKDGTWSSKQFQEIGEKLLPTSISAQDCINLITEMAHAARKNPYLCEAIETFNDDDIAAFKSKIQHESGAVLPDVVVYAMVLEKITTNLSQSTDLMKAADSIWNEAKKPIFLPKYFSLFEVVKLYSLSLEGTIDALRTHKVDPNCFRYGLSINILEATLSDKWHGRHNNAYAGWILATNPAGGKYNKYTGSGPAYISSSFEAPMLHIRTPFTKSWNDLYTCWNLSFVSSYKHFPYLMAKLLIPRVHDYSAAPTTWTFHRLISLYAHIHFELFSRVDGAATPTTMNWKYKPLTRHFGAINAKNAEIFKKMVEMAKK